MKKSWLLTAMAAFSLVGSVAATAPAAAAVRPDVPVVTICLTYARSFCADVRTPETSQASLSGYSRPLARRIITSMT